MTPITTTIATHYKWKQIAMAVVCLGLGLWGAYDYWIKIPRAQERADRKVVLVAAKEALDKEEQPGELSEAAIAKIDAHIAALDQIPDSELSDEDREWMGAFSDARAFLQMPRVHGAFTDEQLAVYSGIDESLKKLGRVEPPSKFDRVTQWFFILCLPFVPWFVWEWKRVEARVYRLDEDGTLHLPEGSWTQDEVADIDMSKWMAKSMAWVVHRDGRRVLLDDYKHKNLHLIVGAIASRFYPDQWTAEAKLVKPDAPPAPAADATGDAEMMEPEPIERM